MTHGGKGGGPTRLGGSGSDSGGGHPAAASSAELAASSSASMSMADQDALQDSSMVGEVLDGRYRIVKKLGEGGMGEVYAAEHVHIAKKVAIKLLRKEVVSNEEAVSRFRQEARSASTIGHRNIIGIDDFGQLKDGRIYLCMEYLNGAALNDIIVQPQPAERLLNILIQTGHGLAAAHAKGIVHRDMKPENIFVTITPSTSGPGEDVPKILDFGIAKVGGQDGGNNLTKTGTIFGTPYYMAPEQALGQAVDARVDIYALGVILYEVFSGSLPFQGESFMGVLTQHITTEPEPVAQRAAKAGRTLPPGLAELIARAMAKDPERRFRTMDELVNGLVAIYRNIAGAGMSSYLEAQPRASASSPSVGPGAGMSAVGGVMAQTIAAPGAGSMPSLQPGGSGPHPGAGASMGMPGGGHPAPSGPHGQAGPHGPHGSHGPHGPHGPLGAHPGSGPHGPSVAPGHVTPPAGPPGWPGSGPYAPAPYGAPPAHPGASGMYPGDSGMVAPPKSKAGLIAIIIAAVVVIGGVVAILVIPRGKDDEQAASAIDAALTGPAGATDAGGGVVAPAIDAGGGVVEPAIDAATAVEPAIDAGAATSNTVVVLVHSRTASAVVYDNGTRLGKVPQTVIVAPGEEHAVLLKAPGFKDEELTVDGREPRIDVVMQRVGGGPGTGHGSGPGTGHGGGPGTGSGPGTGHTPPPPDCDNNPADPRCSM
jgi:serine/threonine-protein kinase